MENNVKSTIEKINDFSSFQTKEDAMEYIKEYIKITSSSNSFKYNSITYSQGDYLIIKEHEDINSIAEFLGIIPFNGLKSHPQWPTMEVKWFYKKTQINCQKNKIPLSLYNSISEYEIFTSNHKDIIPIESLVCKCDVYTVEKYQNLTNNSDLIFFTRAHYDPIKEILTPPIDKWDKSPCCDMPINPDLVYVKCDQCQRWLHTECEGITNEKAREMEKFYCNKCRA